MKRLTASILLCCCFILLLFTLDAASKASPKKKACARNLNSCPPQGCGGRADFLLNRAKNRVSRPATSDVIDMTLDDIRHIEQPDTWQANKNRSELQGPRKEGQPVRVMGYLWKAKREHAESCNCGLDASGAPGELLTDIHMVLTDHPDDAEALSVTAEITPRVRARRPNPVTWTWSKIKLLNGKFIRVTGYLMLDTEHLIHNPLVRSTNWEVHPITKLEVCTLTQAECEAGNGWRNVP